MKIIYRDGLLFTAIEIGYAGRQKTIDNVVIDTGATHTVISPDAVVDIGIEYELGDRIAAARGIGGRQPAFGKQLDWIKCGPFCVSLFDIDFGVIDPEGNINGLLGLDLLLKVGALLDLKNLLLYEGA